MRLASSCGTAQFFRKGRNFLLETLLKEVDAG
jgi:hypothetical protein